MPGHVNASLGILFLALLQPVPLKQLIAEAVKRWFEETLVEAQRGDVKQQVSREDEGHGKTSIDCTV